MQLQNKKNWQRIRFRVGSSSEDPSHPASNLAQQKPTGWWASAQFCSYPQHLTLSFQRNCQLRQIQILSHQSLISSKLQFQAMSNNGQWVRLGRASLDSNANNNYSSRELKSVAVQVECTALRVTLYKNHINHFNAFNQVALCAIAIYGLLQFEAPKSKPVFQPQLKNAKLDLQTKQEIDQLQKLKIEAVNNQDFDRAKALKGSIDKLVEIGGELAELEERKLYAISVEDYDSAQVLSQQIKRLRAGAGQNKDTPSKPKAVRKAAKQRQPDPPYQPPPQRPQVQMANSFTNEFEPSLSTVKGKCVECGMQSEYLTDPDCMDVHLYRDCKGTALCRECRQVVVLSELSTHLLTECEIGQDYVECPQCKVAVKSKLLKGHMQGCVLLQGQARCVLCLQDVQKGWPDHIQKCAKNRR